MKKTITCILSLLLVSVLFISVFTACKSNGNDKPSGGETTNETETKKPEITDTPDIKDGILTFRDGEGMTFDAYSTYGSEMISVHLPKTYEAWIKLPEDVKVDMGTVISDIETERTWVSKQPSPDSFSLQIAKNGVPQLVYKNEKTSLVIKFNGAKLPANEWVHLAIVDDAETGTAYCYINGELKQTITLTGKNKTFERFASREAVAVGGDFQFGLGNSFKGAIKSVTTFDSLRTQEEIKADMTSIDLNNANLISCFDIANSKGKATLVDHKGNYTLINNRMTKDWINSSDMAPLDDFDYSIAFLGDTQTTVRYFPETLHTVFDWLLKNKETHKIEHLLNGGDITEEDTEPEWKLAQEQYFRLNGILDYTLTRGDHDKSSRYDTFFGVPEYSSRFDGEDAGYMGNGASKTNSYRKVKLGGQDYLILTLDYEPKASELDWAESILQKYTKETVIITNHRYLNNDYNYLKEGSIIFERLASKYSNVKFCMCGHEITDNVMWKKNQGVDGHVVNQIMVNPQEAGLDIKGPLGMVCMLYFKNGSDDVQVRYYSTMYDRYFLNTNQFTINTADMSVKRLANDK